jgi:hypothetical protein
MSEFTNVDPPELNSGTPEPDARAEWEPPAMQTMDVLETRGGAPGGPGADLTYS